MAGEGKLIISYAHEKEGAFYQATVSQIDGVCRATWTVSKAGRDKRKDGVVFKEQFTLLWNTIADSPVFHRCALESPDASIDPVANHVVGIAFDLHGEQGVVSHLIPVSERAPEFLAWLRALSATYHA
jgi:hypothetical protein